jgi:hypothetical protein
MNQHDPIRELIDACRPGSDDLGLPEAEELADRIAQDDAVASWRARTERFDRAIAEAFGVVNVPAGLEARLLAAASERRPQAADPLSPVAADGPQPAATQPARGRRHWLLAGSVAAACLLALAAGTLRWWRPRPTIDRATVADAADRWLDELLRSEQPWRSDLDHAALVRYEPSDALLASPAAWRPFAASVRRGADSLSLDRSGVVYEIPGKNPGQLRTLLFVLRTTAQVDAASIAPQTPTRVTGGWSIGVWREGDVLYVLAVEGDQRRYKSLVKPPPRLA